jgi:predicted small metal-binding protein
MIQPNFPVKPLGENTTGVMQKIPVMSFCCRDIGMDCSFKSTGSTEPGLLRAFIHHAESSHELAVLPADLLLKIKGAIKRNSLN